MGVTQSAICSGKVRSQCSNPINQKNRQYMATIIDAFMNPNTPIEVIDEKSVERMERVYGEPAKSLGDQQYSAYRK